MNSLPETGRANIDRHGPRKRPFQWDIFIACLGVSGLAVFICGLLMDNMLRLFDIGISPWRDALLSGFFSFLFSIPIAPALWRLGLVTLPQYLLGAMAVFVPLTILSTIVVSPSHDIMIKVPGFDDDAPANQLWALTAYIRLARSAIFVPVFLFTFWFSYHYLCNMDPKR